MGHLNARLLTKQKCGHGDQLGSIIYMAGMTDKTTLSKINGI